MTLAHVVPGRRQQEHDEKAADITLVWSGEIREDGAKALQLFASGLVKLPAPLRPGSML